MNDLSSNLEKVIAYITKEYLFVGVFICFIAAATVISSEFSRDSAAYNRMFVLYGSSGWGAIINEMSHREIFFLVISKIFFSLDIDVIFLFLTFSIISLSVKFYLIENCSRDKWLSLTLFASYFLILHDSTQIRFSLAIAFSYLALWFLSKGKKLLFCALVVISAMLFHVVSLVFVIMLFFNSNKSLPWLFGMVALAIALYTVNLNDIFLNFVGGTVDNFSLQGTFINSLYRYLSRPSADIFLGMFSRSAMLVYLCAIVIFHYRDKFSSYELVCYNAFILSIFFYILLKDSVDLQVRIRDLFGFSFVFLVPFIHRMMSDYIGYRNAYIVLYLYLSVHLIKFAIYDKMLVY